MIYERDHDIDTGNMGPQTCDSCDGEGRYLDEDGRWCDCVCVEQTVNQLRRLLKDVAREIDYLAGCRAKLLQENADLRAKLADAHAAKVVERHDATDPTVENWNGYES
jgi:regulator of replication initiation timing